MTISVWWGMQALEYFKEHLDDYLVDLETLVRMETPSGDLSCLSTAADWLQERFGQLGPAGRTGTPRGPLLHLEVPGSRTRVLMIAHYDTVYPVGSWSTPWRVEDGKVFGPGVHDMKGGLLSILWTLTYLQQAGLPRPTVEILLTPDEETGSQVSREPVEAACKNTDAALVFEAPMPKSGNLKVARKGTGWYVLQAHGKPAHQGVEPGKGVNAVVELAKQIPRVLELEDLQAGTTLGPNVVRGGSVSNVVADYAEVIIDLRVWSMDEARRVEAALRALEPELEGSSLSVEGSMNRPPMKPTEASMRLFELAKSAAVEAGLTVKPDRVGGGSDGNFTAALGVPTLDGLGPNGQDSHQKTEQIMIREIPLRLALVTGLLQRLAVPHPLAE